MKIKLWWVTLVVALGLAATAGYCSVVGIATLFGPIAIVAGIIATLMEVAKVLSISFLYRNWKGLSRPFKVIMTSIMVVAFVITTIGVYGFLSAGWQKTKTKVLANTIAQSIGVSKGLALQSQIDMIQTDLKLGQERLRSLNQIKADQEVRLNQAISGQNWRTAAMARKEITATDNDLRSLSAQVTAQINQVADLRQRVIIAGADAAKADMAGVVELGMLQNLTDVVHLRPETSVNLFIIMLMLAFDPFACGLFIATNYMQMKDRPPVKVKRRKRQRRTARVNIPVTARTALLDAHRHLQRALIGLPSVKE